MPCPNGNFDYFEDFSNICKRQLGKNLDYYSSLAECEQSSVSIQIANNQCEKAFVLSSELKHKANKNTENNVWSQACSPGYEKSRKMVCIKTCPQGFDIYEEYCIKPQRALNNKPYLWVVNDQKDLLNLQQ